MRIGLRQFAHGDYAGCYFLNANSREKPQVVDKQVQPILDQTEVYSGCYGYARRCEIQLAYAIGMKEPVSVNVNCFGTASVPEIQLARMARRQYDLTLRGSFQRSTCERSTTRKHPPTDTSENRGFRGKSKGGLAVSVTYKQGKQIQALRGRNLGYRAIAAQMGISRDTVRNYCVAHQLSGVRAGTDSKPMKACLY